VTQPSGFPGAPAAEKKATFLERAAKTTLKFHFAPHFVIIVSIDRGPDYLDDHGQLR
jgi:hypothetical protein